MLVISIGFTGTQEGMTANQLLDLAERLNAMLEDETDEIEAHHGDCIGADEQFHRLLELMFPYIKIIIHPPDNPKKRAFCVGDLTLPMKPYLDRNHDIVDSSDYLIATPKENEEVLRSGTWATIRYASKKDVTTFIIYRENGNDLPAL